MLSNRIGPGVLCPHKRLKDRSKYTPHQGKREIARHSRKARIGL